MEQFNSMDIAQNDSVLMRMDGRNYKHIQYTSDSF